MANNPIRPSQFIFSHGPGSVLQTTRGPVIVKDMGELFRNHVENRDVNISGEARQLSITDFEVKERRLSQNLGGTRFCRLPSNQELGLEDSRPVYPTEGGIPAWSLCENHGILYKGWKGGRYQPCWKCNQENKEATGERYLPQTSRIEMAANHAVRFVSACHEGHLQEVPWKKLVCEEGCSSDWLSWSGGGQKIGMVWIRCRKCGGAQNLGEMYANTHQCSGWHCHISDYGDHGECEAPARIQQRGSAGLWIPEIASSLDISSLPYSVFKALGDSSLIASLNTMSSFGVPLNPETFVEALKNTSLPLSSKNGLKRRAEDEMRWPILRDAIIREIHGEAAVQGDLREEEFFALIEAAENGSPPPPVNPEDSIESIFRVNQNYRYDLEIGGLTIRVAPIENLRVVHALVGFKREVSSDHDSSMVDLAFEREGRWTPAMESLGEGVFMYLIGGNDPVMQGNSRRKRWIERTAEEELSHPTHVWWHTLSHYIIDLLGVDSGFSSSSIRERTYFLNDEDGPRGGLLLYTSSPASDGTLGGLVNIAKDSNVMGSLLREALSSSEVCSNDPLCEESVDSKDGAACYACCLVSETSCEHRNKLLDRLILNDE